MTATDIKANSPGSANLGEPIVVGFDGPGSDIYKIEGKSRDDNYEVPDASATGADKYYLKGVVYGSREAPGGERR